ncbi:MAG: tetratricopeptide repeat protein [Bacteroidota bacterium]
MQDAERSRAPLTSSGTRILLALLLVAAVTFVVFSPSLKNDFIGWDDKFYILENPFITSLSPANIGAMFSQFYFKSYTPLSHLSHAVDFKLWGLDPRGHHLVNILFHAANAAWMLLLAVALFRRRQPNAAPLVGGVRPSAVDAPVLLGAVVAALFFALHPIRVESVACASSRKDVLSTFFALPSLLAYLAYARCRGDVGASRYYLLSLLLFVLSVLAKGSVMTLPGVMLLIDALMQGSVPTDRGSVWRLVRGYVPFAIVAAGAAVVAYTASEQEVPNQGLRGYGNTVGYIRVPHNYGFYVVKTLWPAALSAVYRYWEGPAVYAIGTGAVLLTLGAVLLFLRRRYAFPLAWGSYLILLMPVAGFVPASIQMLANRYAYFATAGFALLAGWGFTELWRRESPRWVRPAALVVTESVLCAMAMVSAASMPAWRNATAVWSHALAVDPWNPLARMQMGLALEDEGDYPGAIGSYYNALELYPDYPECYSNLGGVLTLAGDTLAADWALTKAVTLAPQSHFVYTNLGNLRLVQRRPEEAAALYRKALTLNPGDLVTAYDYGYALMVMGKYPEAAKQLGVVLKLNPNYRDAYYVLGMILGQHLGDRAGAVEAFRRGARLGNMECRRVLLEMGTDW